MVIDILGLGQYKRLNLDLDMKRLTLFILFALSPLFAQDQNVNSITFNAPQPPQVTGVSASVVSGRPSINTYVYWVVPVYPIGRGPISRPFMLRNVPDSGTVRIGWNPATGATGYDVLRTTSVVTTPTTGCGCALVVNQSAATTGFTDTLGATIAYSVSNFISTTSAVMTLDNLNYTSPSLVCTGPGCGIGSGLGAPFAQITTQPPTTNGLAYATGTPNGLAIDSTCTRTSTGTITCGSTTPVILSSTKGLYATAAVCDGITDDAPAIQSQINVIRTSGASGTIILPYGECLINTPLDLTNMAQTALTIKGSGRSQLGITTAGGGKSSTTLIGNTGVGKFVLDTTGSQYLTLEDFIICAISTCTDKAIATPSDFGILMARSTTSLFAQFHDYRRLTVFLPSRVAASGRGTIGIYNISAEHWRMEQVQLIADAPLIMTATNILTLASTYVTIGGAASMTSVKLDNMAFNATKFRGMEVWSVQNIICTQCYSTRSGTPTSTEALALNGADHFYFDGQIENTPQVATFSVSATDVNLRVMIASATSPYITFGGNNIRVSSSTVNINQQGGTPQAMFDAGVNAGEVYDGIIYLENGQSINNPTKLTLYGYITYTGVTPTVTVAAGSTYTLISDTNIILKGTSQYDIITSSTNCSSSASPAVCAAAPVGSVVIAAAATSVVVNTTAVTANSQIFVQDDSGLGTKLGVTCNTQALGVLGSPRITARTAATSFTITIDVGPTTNPLCLSYSIIN